MRLRCSALLLGLGLVAAIAPAQTASDQYKTIQTSWTPPTYQACNFTASPAVNTACVNGYREILTPPSGTSGVAITVPPCSGTVTTGCIGNVSTYKWSPGGYLYSGTWSITLAVAYLDNAGAQQYTSTIGTTVNVPNPFAPPSPATGFTANPAP